MAVAVAGAAALVLFVSLVSHLVCLSRLGAFHAFVSRRAHEISIQLSMNERGEWQEGLGRGRGGSCCGGLPAISDECVRSSLGVC